MVGTHVSTWYLLEEAVPTSYSGKNNVHFVYQLMYNIYILTKY